MDNSTNVVNIGSDIRSFQIDWTNPDGTETDMSNFNSLELHLVDEFGVVYAKYLYPFGSEEGYHELRLPFTSITEFDIHKEESDNFRPGTLYANVILKSDDSEFPDGIQLFENYIPIAEVRV